MTYRMALLSAIAICAAALPRPAAAADYYDAGRGAAYDQGEPGFDDDGPVRQPHGPGAGDRRLPGPVVYDERDPERHGVERGFGPGRAVPFGRPRFGDAGPLSGPEPVYGWRSRPMVGYRAVDLRGEADGFGPGEGRPDAGCTIEQAESITPAGWRKIVTHRTCYRR